MAAIKLAQPTCSQGGFRHFLSPSSLVLNLVLLALASLAHATQAGTTVASGQSTFASTAPSLPTPTSGTLIHPGTDCTSYEALFNCLITSWQQCASGQWSIAIDGSNDDALICSPGGLSYDMEMMYANGTVADPVAVRTGSTGTDSETGKGARETESVVASDNTNTRGNLQLSGVSAVRTGWLTGGTWHCFGVGLSAIALML